MSQTFPAFRYTEVLSDDEARKRLTDFRKKTEDNLNHLKEQCEQKGNTILARWQKKRGAKREAFLLEVDPQMYLGRWPEIEFAQKQERATHMEGYNEHHPDNHLGIMLREHRNICLLPYLSMGSLKDDGAKILKLIHNRIAFSPQQWAVHDNQILDKQWKLGSLETAFNRNSVVMHGSQYGELVAWSAAAAHAQDTIGYPRAVLVFEAQYQLSEVLRSFVDKILEGSGPDKGNADTFNKAVQAGLQKWTGKSSCVEFASTFLNQPFAAPPSFSVKALLDISQGQLNLHSDHLWNLQIDPTSFRDYAGKVVDGGGRGLTKTAQRLDIAMKLIEDSNTRTTWEWIVLEVQKIQQLENGIGHSVRPGTNLPAPYSRAIEGLGALVTDLMNRLAIQIFELLPTRAGFVSKWDLTGMQQTQNMAAPPSRMDGDRNMVHLYEKDILEFCLMSIIINLIMEPMKLASVDGIFERLEYNNHDLTDLFAMLDEHLSRSAKDKTNAEEVARLDELLYDFFSDLAALHQINSIIRIHRPTVVIPSIKVAQGINSGKAWQYMRAGYLDAQPKGMRRLVRGIEAEQTEAQNALATLVGNFLKTPKPAGSRATQKWLDQDEKQRAESALVWAQMRSHQRQILTRLKIDNEYIEEDVKVLSADISPEHIAHLENEREQVENRIKEIAAEKEAKKARPKTDPQTQWGSNTPTAEASAASKIKTKTRTEQSIPELGRQLAALPIAEPAEPKVRVRRGNLEVLRALYPNPNFEERTKFIEWTAFVAAFGEVGFRARATGHGSIYAIEPVEGCRWFRMGAINVHKPHKYGTKYSAVQFLKIGRQMSRWFGWSAETFELMPN